MNKARMATSVVWFLLLTFASGRLSAADPADGRLHSTTRSGSWLILESKNFRICTQSVSLDLDRLPGLCESLRSSLRSTWLDEQTDRAWLPRCDVIVHPTLDSYSKALGPSAGNSVGCATIQLDSGRVVRRRVDIRLDDDGWDVDALPHELTHVVLADRFCTQRIPPWADEGMGILAESAENQRLRADALDAAAARGHVFRIDELLKLERFPSATHRDAFYGQSAALVQWLVQRGDRPSEILDFVELSLASGYEHALKTVYGIDGAAVLAAQMDKHIYQPGRLSEQVAEIVAASSKASLQTIVD